MWCGENKPPILMSRDRAEIIFKTDRYIQRSGFLFKYYLNGTDRSDIEKLRDSFYSTREFNLSLFLLERVWRADNRTHGDFTVDEQRGILWRTHLLVGNSGTPRQERRSAFRDFRTRGQLQVSCTTFQLDDGYFATIRVSYRCMYDKVTVYDGAPVLEENKLATLCGNLTGNMPIFKSNSSSMVVEFMADESFSFKGFSAKVNLSCPQIYHSNRRVARLL